MQARLRRGDADVDPREFDISACLDSAGRALLTSDERADAGAGAAGG